MAGGRKSNADSGNDSPQRQVPDRMFPTVSDSELYLFPAGVIPQ